ncbi:alpha-hydroxy acid oxidase [Pseudoprimorskyibacter insulae]|nr:alpha-hydroxy acid oxidase [Pseudoprimorskyibacter insulae]
MDLHSRFPSIHDLRVRARRRIPKFVWDYLDSATGTEATMRRNRAMLDRVMFTPSILHGEFKPDLGTTLFGRSYDIPVGIAPVGMSGLMWPDAERLLAKAATKAGLPYGISTVATQTPEDVGPCLDGNGWFQMYPPRDPEIRQDMLDRAKQAGFSTLVLTVDVPVASRRERQVRSGLVQPPRLTPRLLAQVAMRPAWARQMALRKLPHMRTLDRYTENVIARNSTAHVGYLLRTSPDWDYVQWLRDAWDGPFVIKGVLNPDDAVRLEGMGVDAIWVSNHAGRQFDAALSSIECLPAIRDAVTCPIIIDSGFEGGLDVLRAMALGADFVMFGRAFHYALAALGAKGPAHLIDILRKDMEANMGQMGTKTLADCRGRAFWDPRSE